MLERKERWYVFAYMRIPCRPDFMYRLLFEIVFSETLFDNIYVYFKNSW